MSKELTALEAAKDIRECLFWSDEGLKRIDVIEKALKELETLEEEKQSFDRQLEKKLKALKIITEKSVNVYIFQHSGDLQTYHDMVDSEDRKLTKEEFDLLKEILL